MATDDLIGMNSIVYDQYGRILDGNQRQRVARLRGLAVPFTIMQVRDDAHAIEIARAANAIRRHYTPEQRQELAPILRDQGFSYRAIAEALGVGKSTVYRDMLGELRIRDESESERQIVPNGTLPDVTTEPPPESVSEPEIVPNGTTPEHTPYTQDAVDPLATRPQRVMRKGGGTYPAQRPTEKRAPTPKLFDVQAIETKIKDLYMDWLRHCETDDALETAQFFLNTLSDLAQGRGMQLHPSR